MTRPTVKFALRVAAMERLTLSGISLYPYRSEPTIDRRHIDGPNIKTLDGQVFWLSPCERLLTKLRIWDAWDIEWRRCPLPDFSDAP